MRLLRMVLLGVGLGGTVGLAMHGCRPTEQTAQQGLGGAHAHFADSERGDAGDDVSNLVGAIAAPESAAQLRLKFLRLSEQTAGSGTDFQFIPGSDEVLMTLREGKLARLSLGDRRAALLDVWAFREEMLLTDACGVSNLAVDPGFERNKFIYVTYCASPTRDRLVRYTLDEKAGPTRPVVVYEIETPAESTSWRRFGSLGWLDEETLWLLVGDHEQSAQAQDPTSPLGSLVFLRPNRDAAGQGPEPIGGAPGGSSSSHGSIEIHASGFRAPWRATRDQLGRFWVGDVGEDDYEEVNRVSRRGQNFGWDLYTGPCGDGCSDSESPVAYYGRSPDDALVVDEPDALDSESRAIWVGQIYERPATDRYLGQLSDAVVFGDLFTGAVRALSLDAQGEVLAELPIGFLPYVTQWRPGPDGYIYVLDLAGNLHVALLEGSQLL